MHKQEIEAMIGSLTLTEKLGMIHGAGLFRTEGVLQGAIPPLYMSDGPMGVRQEFENDAWTPNRSDDYVTYLPSGSAIAATWNRELAEAYGTVLGAEARGRGKDMILAPGVNIIRSPLCGRNFEYLSEDPLLTAELATAMVRGIQSKDVAACVKHFVANNQETNRLGVDVKVSEEALKEIYYPAFKACIQQGGALGVMGAYNKIDGEWCSQSSLLNSVLRKQWGFSGVVVSDWGAVTNTVEAAQSGIDIEMSVTNNFDQYYLAEPLAQEIKTGNVAESLIDEKVRRILQLMFQLKMLGDQASCRCAGEYNTKEHRDMAYRIAQESIVLLKNSNATLPLCKDKISKLLVIGDNAERMHALGGGSAEVKALYEISPLMALRSRLGGNCEIRYVKGYLYEEPEAPDAHWQESSLEIATGAAAEENASHRASESEYASKGRNHKLRQEAVELAAQYENTLLFVGLNHHFDTEGKDRESLALPYEQKELIEAVLQVNPNTIVVLLSGSAVDMRSWVDAANTLMWNSYNGMEGGNALVDVLLGDISPSGKLTQTFGRQLEDYASHSVGEFPGAESVTYAEGTAVGYRHFQGDGPKPLFCFGHGLSYTSFRYTDLKADQSKENPCKWNVQFYLHNCGSQGAKEVWQIYTESVYDGSSTKPRRVLRAFDKVYLRADETKHIAVSLTTDAPVECKFFVGSSFEQAEEIGGHYEIKI